MKDISEKGKVNPSKVTGRLDDDKYDKRILTLVNKIEELDENNTPLKPKTTSNVAKWYWKKIMYKYSNSTEKKRKYSFLKKEFSHEVERTFYT